MDVILILAGAALLVLALRDIFETLFHPTGHGVIGRHISHAIWHALHRLHRGGGAPIWAGPLGYITVLAGWTAMLVIGWALIFLPYLPDGFHYSGLDPEQHRSFVDAVYISLVNITSLGYGDISPEADLLRILGPVETLFGLGLLTASISWLVSIYGALRRREALTHEVTLLRNAERELGEPLADAEPALLERMLYSLGQQTIEVRRDLIHLPIINYFQSEEERAAREDLRAFMRELVQQARDERRPTALRLQAEMLAMALDDFERTIEDGRSPRGRPAS